MNVDYIALGEELLYEMLYEMPLSVANSKAEIREFFHNKQKEQDSKIVQLGSNPTKPESSLDWNPRQALMNVINDQEYSIDKYSKMVMFQLDDSHGQYQVRFTNVGMKASEAISLAEVGKTILLESMGY